MMGEGKLLFLTSEEGTSGVEGCVVRRAPIQVTEVRRGLEGNLFLRAAEEGEGRKA
jgi:hypothetical protein